MAARSCFPTSGAFCFSVFCSVCWVFFKLVCLLFICCVAVLFLHETTIKRTNNNRANTTTFVIPGEVFPTSVRATCHGASAAAGKVGAVIGAFYVLCLRLPNTKHTSKHQTTHTQTGAAALNPLSDMIGVGAVLIICAVVAAMGL